MAPSAPIRVGTAGWAYEDWDSIVYPEKPGPGFDRLALMATLFDTNEVNSTFYRIPPARMTARWTKRVAHNPRFTFTVKLFRGFTHEGKAGAEDEKAFAEAMEPLARERRLGCVLAQFPFSFHNTGENRRRLEKILGSISAFPAAAEFRHSSWDTEEVRELLARHRAAFVNIDQPRLDGNLPATGHVTAPIAYFRFHGRNAPKWFGPDTSNEERYNYLYSKEELSPWLDRIRQAQSSITASGFEGRSEKGVYAILNNHFRGQAVANALELENMLSGRVETIPGSLLETYPALAAIARPFAPEQRQLF